MISEAEIHVEVERIIRSGDLTSRISKDDLDFLEHTISINPDLLPAFSIDEYVRTRFAESASTVIGSLKSVEVLTSNNNISITKNEILKPDLVCINPETNQLIIFELKKSNQTGRQALTELLAYEHELKNHLPFLSNYDATFVLISTEWSTLLEHAATSAVMWSNKNLLCLHLEPEPNNYQFKVHKPSTWNITGTPFFPDDSVSTITISFEIPSTMDDEEADHCLYNALSFYAREAEQTGLHGFGLLSKNLNKESSREITLCAASPFAFFDAMLTKGKIDTDKGHLASKLISHIESKGKNSGIHTLLRLKSKVLDPRLKGFENIEVGKVSNWNIVRNEIQESRFPFMTEFWGLPGGYARSYISNPAVQKARSSIFPAGTSHWHDPNVGIWLIRNLFEQKFTSDGFVRPSDSLRLGVAIGRHLFLTDLARKSTQKPKNLYALMFWNFASLAGFIDEIFILARTANDVEPPTSRFDFSAHGNEPFDPEPVVKWIKSQILHDTPFHTATFDLGFKLAPAITPEDLSRSQFSSIYKSDMALIHETAGYVASIIKHAITETAYCEDHKKELIAEISNKLCIPLIKKSTDLRAFENRSIDALCDLLAVTMQLANSVVPAVTHLYDDLPPMVIDWDNLKRGVDGMYQDGKKRPAVYILANGMIGTASYDDNLYAKFIMDIKNRDEEVYLMDVSRGIEMFRIVKWEELRNGSVIPLPK
ncbi:hypothetical protein [Pseudomonas canadensis]|uniref:Uncharacterized protein n=1 Tax=Pseudomonas canadensis TaxID=915099 RepID=A0ABZ1A906_9PSED|nr:hypothetical protein [Pseudomonas canadensis]WRI25173.1 hypothetical protein SPL95_02285 [Pseudomonas canadensis]